MQPLPLSAFSLEAFNGKKILAAMLGLRSGSCVDFVVSEVNERAAQVALQALQPSANLETSSASPSIAPTQKSQVVPLGLITKGHGLTFSVKIVGICLMRGFITYMTIPRLYKISFYYNAAAGVGKCASAFLNILTDRGEYKRTQNLFEEGLFHLLTTVYDYALTKFSWVRAIFAGIYAMMPSEGLRLHALLYIPFTGAIPQESGASEPKKQQARQGYCAIQRFADIGQELLFPSTSDGNNYWQNLWGVFKKSLS
jgi:hypothetical protein